jgi:hypothetical protein
MGGGGTGDMLNSLNAMNPGRFDDAATMADAGPRFAGFSRGEMAGMAGRGCIAGGRGWV